MSGLREAVCCGMLPFAAFCCLQEQKLLLEVNAALREQRLPSGTEATLRDRSCPPGKKLPAGNRSYLPGAEAALREQRLPSGNRGCLPGAEAAFREQRLPAGDRSCLLETKALNLGVRGRAPTVISCTPAMGKTQLSHNGNTHMVRASPDSTGSVRCCSSPSNHPREL